MDLGEGWAHWGGGDGLRTWQRHTVEKDRQGASLFDTDPVVQGYVHALKRLVTHMESVQPSVDPSRSGHVPAPVPDASELGLAVSSSIRDSDGSLREPEFVEPENA